MANAKMTKERRKITRLRTCGGSQMTNEDIREYLSSSCANLTNHVCETHFGVNKRRWQWFRHLVMTSVTSKNSGSVVVTRLIIWSTHGELFLQTLRRTVTIAQPETMRQCAEREVGKDNLDTGLMITSTLLVFRMKLMVLRTPVLRILLKRNRDNSRQRPKRINIFLFLTTAQTKTVQHTMTVEKLLHRVASCRSAADDANLFSCPHEDCTQPAKETVERRVIPNSIIVILPWRNDISNFFTSPFGLSLSAPPQTESNGTFFLATTCCILSTVLLVFSRRIAMMCLTMLCPVKHHGRYSK